MSTLEVPIFCSSNLSIAWSKAFRFSMEHAGDVVSPLVVRVDVPANGIPRTSIPIESALNEFLAVNSKQAISTVASTIFPNAFWDENSPSAADELYKRYDKIWPRLKKCRPNCRGTYFRRLTAYKPKIPGAKPINQLQKLVEKYEKGNHSRSALQLSTVDITQDLNSTRPGFPCLQQIALNPLDKDGLVITGFYGLQYIVERAYGNYVGLCQLGRFLAKEMGLPLCRMICIASVGRRDFPKSDLADLYDTVNKEVLTAGGME